MRRFLFSVANVALLALFCLPSFGQENDNKQEKKSSLRRGTIKILDEEVIPAIKSGDDAYFLQAMAPIIQKATNKQLAEIDLHCQFAGIDSVKTRFADVVLEQVERGNHDLIKKINLSIALYLADELSRKVDDLLQQVSQHVVMRDPLVVSDDWKISEQMFWETHVFNNEFLNAQSFVDFGVAVLKPHYRRIQKSESAESIAILKKIEELIAKVPAAHREMLERDAELRWKRFEASHTRLLNPGDFETLLTSAMCVELDSEKLKEIFAKIQPGDFARPALNDPDLPKNISDMVDSARLVGDQIARKAILLRSGLHYWLRGRYGNGPLAFGLLKSPDSMDSPASMEGLYMPKVRPNAISNTETGEAYSPGFERRHYYTWAVEYRPLLRDASNGSSTESVSEITGAKAGSKFW